MAATPITFDVTTLMAMMFNMVMLIMFLKIFTRLTETIG